MITFLKRLFLFSVDGGTKKDRKKKKKVSTIISFDEDEDVENPDLVVSKFLMSSLESSEEQSDWFSEPLPPFEAQFQLIFPNKENDESLFVNGDFNYEKLDMKSVDDEELDDYDTFEPETVSMSGEKCVSCEQ